MRWPIVFRGEILTQFYVVTKGAVVAQYPRGALLLGPGDFFGERALLEVSPSEATVRCMVSPTTVLAVPAARLRELIAGDPALAELVKARVEARRAELVDRDLARRVRAN